ncbi:MAG: hypothetical protein UU12_C0017G0022 [Candidatus Woesebacteria bacterium GW2011_GWA2_40_7b]|uniref:Uncharacterized protein n=1 Tax=Candidatus Woesebacteria bacterium GW2011_GWA2_40_7b TaxID=1618563 RepID=A0A0G0T7N4_9BACT|nr:MAG: hypothetical protein UU12_C0017G0022 [Candidatus Woesebacteria bacterium GW2011_GWA2_40_7b]
MNNKRILICLYSDANFLALSILESLLSKNSYVGVVTDDVEKWKEITGYESFSEFITLRSIATSKQFVIFPFEIFSSKEDLFINNSENLSVIYIGDLLGPRIDLDSNLLMNQTINQIFEKRVGGFATEEVLYPMFVGDVAKTITKWLFSFGPYGNKLLLLGPPVSASIFGEANQKIVNNVNLKYKQSGRPRTLPRNLEKQELPVNLNFALLETYKWLTRTSSQKRLTEKKKERHKHSKYLLPVTLTFLFIFILPLLTIGSSFGVLYLSYKDMLRGKTETVRNKILIAKTLFTVGERVSGVFAYVPGLRGIYRETGFVSRVGRTFVDTAGTAMSLIKISNETFNNVLGDSVYNPSTASQEISNEMNQLYQDTSNLQTLVLDAQKLNVWSAKYLLSKVNFDKVKNYFKQGKVLAANLPSILGKDKRKTYLVLFHRLNRSDII